MDKPAVRREEYAGSPLFVSQAEEVQGNPKQKKKDRWLFTSRDEPMIGIAGLVRDAPGIGEAFTMLTTEPGADIAPYHNRQVAVLPLASWHSWLDYSHSADTLIRPAPAGTLEVQSAPR